MYSTKEIADIFKIHPNTVFFYERMGFISPVKRKTNGYRVFTDLHVRQIHIIKLIYLKQWPGKKLRNSSKKIIEALPEWNIERLKKMTLEYISAIESEIEIVNHALSAYANRTPSNKGEHEILYYSDAAKELCITKDTLRNWERNHLFSSLRDSGNRKYIDMEILEDLKIIYCLRLSGFSMSAVHSYMNNPEKINEIEVFSAGDHLLEFLNHTLECAAKICNYLVI